MLDTDDTIAAVATARAGAVRGIVRMSGPRTVSILSAVMSGLDVGGRPVSSERSLPSSGVSRRLVHGLLDAGECLRQVPCAALIWPGQSSYTRQPAAEIHAFGSPPVLDAILAALCRAGARLAGPGEFTLRAFLAGRLDLTQAEAVLGVIDAASPSELHAALEQLAGGLAQPLQTLREQLVSLLAHLEAGLDFVEEDLEFLSPDETCRRLRQAARTVEKILDQLRWRAASQEEPRILLRGLPNVGKSSLFNALAGTARALVSADPSTTRDYLETAMALGDRTVLLVDTAGIEEPAGHAAGLVGEAQRIASLQARQAAVELFCVDATRPLDPRERRILEAPSGRPRIVVLTQCDRRLETDWPGPAVATSSHTGLGLAELRHAVARLLDQSTHGESGVVTSTATRCADSLRRAAASLVRAQQLAREQGGDELLAAELRFALDDLGIVVGAVYTDDILDRIFSQFCIGK